MVRVTIELILPEWWGADDAFDAGGPGAVRELIEEDVRAFTDDAKWDIVKFIKVNK